MLRRCWEYTGQGHVALNGYGKASLDGAVVYTHRAVYEALVGPIPRGLEIDHLCRNRACYNPLHLEPVTTAENQRRGAQARGVASTHGTVSMYTNHSCRCADCRRAWRERSRRAA